jgi:phosphoglucomutase
MFNNKGAKHQMDTTNTTPALHEQYNSFATVILELPAGANLTQFVEKTANDIEFTYNRLDSYKSIANTMTNNIEEAKNYLIENYDDLGHHADEIASLLDIELLREVQYSISMSAVVTVTVAMGVDPEEFISENIYIDSSDSSVNIDEYNVDTVYEA